MRKTPALKVRSLQHAKIDNRVLCLQFANHQRDQAEDAEEGPQANLVAAEPVLALARIEYYLQHAKAQGEKADAPQIDASGFVLADVLRIAHEGVHHEQREDANRKIEVEDPAPGVVVGDPAAEGGAEDGREDDAEAEGGHGGAVPTGREGLQQNRLGQRLQASAGEPLQHAEEDQPLQRGGHTAEQRGEGKPSHARHQHAAAPEAVRQPSRHGKNDGVGNQVRSDDPGALFHRSAHVPRDVRNGDVDHRGVENLHERRQHDRAGDDPRVNRLEGATGHEVNLWFRL